MSWAWPEQKKLICNAVAMTRPKRHLCVIGDSETVSRGSPFLKRWMKFLDDNADLRVSDSLRDWNATVEILPNSSPFPGC